MDWALIICGSYDKTAGPLEKSGIFRFFFFQTNKLKSSRQLLLLNKWTAKAIILYWLKVEADFR